MDNCCKLKHGVDIHPALAIVFEGFPLKNQHFLRSWGSVPRSTTIDIHSLPKKYPTGCCGVTCLMFQHRFANDWHPYSVYLNGFKQRYYWLLGLGLNDYLRHRHRQRLQGRWNIFWLWNMAKWSRTSKVVNLQYMGMIGNLSSDFFTKNNGYPMIDIIRGRRRLPHFCSPKLWLLNQGSLNYLFSGIKQCKCMVILKDFPYNIL